MLEINGVTKQYGKKVVFDSVNVKIQSNSVVAVRGKNGTGKTTLLNIIGGLIDFEGDVSYESISLKQNFTKYINHVSFLSNDAFSYQYLTLVEMINFLNSIMKKTGKKIFSEAQVKELIELLELDDYKDVYIKDLSLGTRQKVSVIVNMIDIPKIILLDEPFVNLDQESVNNLLIYLRDYIRNNHAIMIYSTHSQDERLDAFTTNTLNLLDSNKIEFI